MLTLIPRPREAVTPGTETSGAETSRTETSGTETSGTEHFELDDTTRLDADALCAPAATWLRGALGPATGLALRNDATPHADIAARDGQVATLCDAVPDDSDLVAAHAGADTPQAEAASDVLAPHTDIAPAGAITMRASAEDLGEEGYRLTVRSAGVLIEAGGSAGAFYAAQTLRALLPSAAFRRSRIAAGPWRVPHTTITDGPRFPWRGAMLDVARHFLPKQDVLRFIDLIALHKLNTLHLHLTDDQGWRVEIRRHPRLTEIGAWRRESPLGDRRHSKFDGRPHGGFYTQDDLREIVAYAADRHVTVVPEIDVPGHAGAAIAAYPRLGNTDVPGRPADPEVATRWGVLENVLNAEQSTLEFLYEVFDEVMELFPSRYIGVGGDECPTTQWAASPRAQSRMTELGLADPDAIHTWYVTRLGEHLRQQGRTLFGWDEICDGDLPPGAVVASWRGTEGAIKAARLGHNVVLCPEQQVYLDYRQSEDPNEPIPVGTVSDLAHVHAFDPIPTELTPTEAARVLGGQCNIWTEHMDSARAIDYMAFPRLCAFAESVWSGPTDDHAEFLRRMTTHEQRLDALGVEYRHSTGPLPWQSRPDAPGWPRSDIPITPATSTPTPL